MSAREELLLQPNPADPREMELFASVPEADQQAWLSFLHSSHEREAVGVRPAYTFHEFKNGVAEHVEGFLPELDKKMRSGIGGVALIPNYDEDYLLQEYLVPPLLGAFDSQRTLMERERKKGPIALLVPHASLATPYAVTRSLIHTFGPEISNKVYIVIGPRPTVMEFEIYNPASQQTEILSPVMIGRTEANLLLTGPDTDSARRNPGLQEWLKKIRRSFWERLDEIMEPSPDGDNNIVVFCPAGRVAENGKEFRVDGSFAYFTKYPGLKIWPIGAFDRLLQSATRPGSPVFLHPDASMWTITDDKHANWLHERATMLSQSPLGGLELERQHSHAARLTREKLRLRTKDKSPPYLSD